MRLEDFDIVIVTRYNRTEIKHYVEVGMSKIVFFHTWMNYLVTSKNLKRMSHDHMLFEY